MATAFPFWANLTAPGRTDFRPFFEFVRLQAYDSLVSMLAVSVITSLFVASSAALANTKGPSGPSGHSRPSGAGGTAGQKPSDPLASSLALANSKGNAAATVLAIAREAAKINAKVHHRHHIVDLRGKKFTVETYCLPKISNGTVVGLEQKTFAGWK
jgi:hypothetical protein